MPLIALLVHPLVGAGEGRAAWLENARALDLALRGPRPKPGFAPVEAAIGKLAKGSRGAAMAEWWQWVEGILAPVLALPDDAALAEALDVLASAGEALCGPRLWGEADGRALAAWLEELRDASAAIGTRLARADLTQVLRDAMDRVPVRPTWGGHPRIAIYGLLEARMSRADLVICAGLTEGSWPASPSPEPLLPPPCCVRWACRRVSSASGYQPTTLPERSARPRWC